MNVDVVIPTRDRVELTREAVDSVLAQTHEPRRVIVVDDGGEAANARALRELEGDRVRVVRHERSMGPQAARQTGYEATSAELIACLDSDDLWEPEKLEKQVDLLSSRPDLDVAICWHAWVGPAGVEKVRRPEANGDIPPLTTDNMSTPLFRRAALETIRGFRPSYLRAPLLGASHIEIWLRISQFCRVGTVEDVLVKCRTHEAGRASDAIRTLRGANNLAYAARLHHNFLYANPREQSRLFQRIGARYLEAGQIWTGLRWMFAGAITNGAHSVTETLVSYGPFILRTLSSSDRR